MRLREPTNVKLSSRLARAIKLDLCRGGGPDFPLDLRGKPKLRPDSASQPR